MLVSLACPQFVIPYRFSVLRKNILFYRGWLRNFWGDLGSLVAPKVNLFFCAFLRPHQSTRPHSSSSENRSWPKRWTRPASSAPASFQSSHVTLSKSTPVAFSYTSIRSFHLSIVLISRGSIGVARFWRNFLACLDSLFFIIFLLS